MASITKIDTNGTVIWAKAVNPTIQAGQTGQVSSMIQNSDGSFILGGNSFFNGAYNGYLVKLDSSGNLSCSKGVSNDVPSVVVNEGVVISGGLRSCEGKPKQ